MCPLCGKATIPLARKSGQQRGKGHRKWLYCPWCAQTVNTYEVRNEDELNDFNDRYATGEITESYKTECANLDPKHIHR